jgi:sugar phosphate isomerase/epimerase
VKKLLPGLQLYSVREELARDFAGTMRSIAQMGYCTVEFASYYDIPALQMKAILTETGLIGVSSHLSLKELLSDLYGLIEYSLIIGASYIVIPYILPEQFIDDKQFEELVANLTWIGAELKRYGLQLAYHNHSHEFEQLGGKFLLERLINSISADLLKLEIDVAWMAKAGVDPVTYLPLFKGRIALLHIKDIDREGNITEVGNGILNFPAIYAAAIAAGVKDYFVEQDTSRHPLLSAQMNLNYLRDVGIAQPCTKNTW